MGACRDTNDSDGGGECRQTASTHEIQAHQKDDGSMELRCEECGKECTQVEFSHCLNLCDHLYLDALAAMFKSTAPQPLRGIDEPVKEKPFDCPRCHGLMQHEVFIDWPDNTAFCGWRCLCCGNIWDRMIAVNRSRVGTPVETNRQKKPVLPLVLTLAVHRPSQCLK